MRGRLLFVDDEEMKRTALRIEAEKRGYDAEEAGNAIEGLARIEKVYFDVVVTDLRMPRVDGLTFLRRIREASPDTSVVLMTAYGTVKSAVEAMREGARDYILKPFSADELFVRLDRIMEYRDALALNRAFVGKIGAISAFHGLVGRSRPMLEVFRAIARVAANNATVLVFGESGTGKELVAEAIHHFSERAPGPLVKVSCASLARDVIESELFGHVKGAFTGAVRDRYGRFEQAIGGTLYLDDVDDLPLDVQVKLLRAIQNRQVERVGGDAPIPVDVRVVSSTKVDLEALVKAGRFREDLYYRLNVIQIRLPPLRERREDIPLLARHFLSRFESAAGRHLEGIDPRAVDALVAYDWPGNVRELENAIERAVTFARSETLEPCDLPEKFDRPVAPAQPVHLELEGMAQVDLVEVLAKVERGLLAWAIEKAGGNQGRAAQLLGLPRTTLRDRITRLRLDDRSPGDPPSTPDGTPSTP